MTAVNRFCHFVINKNNKMCPQRLFQLQQGWLQVSIVRQATVCFSCGVGSPTIGEHGLVYILSNDRHLHQATVHLQIIHIGWVILSSPLLERLMWKNNNTTTDGKQYPDIEKHSAQILLLFSHLKILGMFILTAHLDSNQYIKIDWQKSSLPAFRLFTLTWSTNFWLWLDRLLVLNC